MKNITKGMSLQAGKALRPRDIADVVGNYMKEGNMEGVLSMFHKEGTIHFPPAPLAKGWTDIGALFTPFVASRATLISEVTHEIIVGDTALIKAVWKVKNEDGEIMSEGNSTEVVKRKEDGSWVYYIDCPYGPPSV